MSERYDWQSREVPHHRHHGLDVSSTERLSALSRRIPSTDGGPPPVDLRKVARGVASLVTAVLVVAVALAAFDWVRPIPSPVFHRAVASWRQMPGTMSPLPWPASGEAAVSVEGDGSLGGSGGTAPVPVAGLAGVMTAYVVLHDHPLAPGAQGPTIPVTEATVAAASSEAATQQSVVPVTTGETLTELQALEGLLVAQGNDMATLLGDWDAGSLPAFVGKMNSTADALGLRSTHFTDPSGLDPATVSTPADLIRLGEAAMGNATFADVVAMAQVTLPLAGVVYNLDFDLGHDGMIGVKTGSDSAAGGCFLFAARRTVDGRNLVLVGAVLGQGGVSPNTTAVDGADALVRAAFAEVRELPASPRPVVGTITAPWAPSAVPVTVSTASVVVAWPGTRVPVRLDLRRLAPSLSAGSDVGSLHTGIGLPLQALPLRTTAPLPGPTTWWRLTRL